MFFQGRPLNSQIYPCPFKNDACLGGQCGEGYEGQLCAICATDYYLTAHGCLPCDEALSTTLVATILLGVALAGAAIFWLVTTFMQDEQGLDLSEREDTGVEFTEWGASVLPMSDDEQTDQTTKDQQAMAEGGKDMLMDQADGIAGHVRSLFGSESSTEYLLDSTMEGATEAAEKVASFVTNVKDGLWDSVGQFKIMFGVLHVMCVWLPCTCLFLYSGSLL